MHVSHLQLADYRSYEAAYLELEPGVSTFIGPNGQGKTNLVEAIGYLATLGSHRVAHDAPMVRQGADRAIVRGVIVQDGRDTLLEVEITPGKANRARRGGAALPKARDLLGTLRTVLFAPEDLAIVKGDPSGRRDFLDELLVARAPRYAAVRSDYERVLKQRNALLKSAGNARRAGAELRTLDVWDAHLAEAGAALLAGRHELVDALRPLVDKSYAAVSRGGGPTSLDYTSSVAPEIVGSTDRELLTAAMAAALASKRGEELDRGLTLIGPHRDDLVLSIGRGQLVTVPGSLADVFIVNDSVADVQVKSQRQIYVFGKAGGETTLYASDAAGKVIWAANIRVGSNIDSIDQMLALAMPDAKIGVATRTARYVRDVTGR